MKGGGLINVIELTDKIKADPDKILLVLDHLGYEDVRDCGKYFQFRNIDGDNPSANTIYKDTLHWNNYTRGLSGDLITLVMYQANCNFGRALLNVTEWTDIQVSNIKVRKPFGGFYTKITRSLISPETEMPVYSESSLPAADSLSKKFLDDGVDLLTQEKYGIRYCHELDQIIIPERNVNGQLVGAKQRNNDPNCPMEDRWGMFIPYKKSLCLFGYSEHYMAILQKRVCVIFEAEKSVMIGDSNKFQYGLAIGGHSISETQAKYIKSLGCKKIILAFDEGICNEEIEFNAKKLQIHNPIYQNKVGFINTKALKEGSKDSPIDGSFEQFKYLMQHEIKWV